MSALPWRPLQCVGIGCGAACVSAAADLAKRKGKVKVKKPPNDFCVAY